MEKLPTRGFNSLKSGSLQNAYSWIAVNSYPGKGPYVAQLFDQLWSTNANSAGLWPQAELSDVSETSAPPLSNGTISQTPILILRFCGLWSSPHLKNVAQNQLWNTASLFGIPPPSIPCGMVWVCARGGYSSNLLPIDAAAPSSKNIKIVQIDF